MKIDFQWDYNNVQIKKKDEWKIVFIAPEGLFELTVMFFGLMNSPATFQTMIYNILQDLINIGKVVRFIDNVIVGTEMKEGHDEIVKEVVKRLAENDLYITRKMQVEGVRSKILGSINRTRRNQDGRRENERYIELTGFTKN